MNVNSLGSTNTQTMSATKAAENSLGKDAFLEILVTQMKNQNPLEPLKDTEFIGQMAQFSSLEQLTNLNTTMGQFIGLQLNQALTVNADMIGNKVHWEREINGQVESGEGIVKALAIKNGELIVELEPGDIKVPLYAIHRIEDQTAPSNEQEIV
jgi:flagellar basal-body rod modification protein FlgD